MKLRLKQTSYVTFFKIYVFFKKNNYIAKIYYPHAYKMIPKKLYLHLNLVIGTNLFLSSISWIYSNLKRYKYSSSRITIYFKYDQSLLNVGKSFRPLHIVFISHLIGSPMKSTSLYFVVKLICLIFSCSVNINSEML